jgi:hypothetical protein
MINDFISVVYGATPRDSGESRYNEVVALGVSQVLGALLLPNKVIGLSSFDQREIFSEKVFNLCDGDCVDGERFGLVAFAKELEAEGKKYTGSNSGILELAMNKTLSWAKSFKVPPHADEAAAINSVEGLERFIAKPRRAHGSLFITHKNVDSVESFCGGEFFFQKYLGGAEFTSCFIGRQFLGTCKLNDSGIITRDDKWEKSYVESLPKRLWDLSGQDHPEVKEQACLAWNELLSGRERPGELAYGRVDLKVSLDGEVYVIDVNPNAYLGQDGLLYSCWQAQGGSYEKLISLISSPLFL